MTNTCHVLWQRVDETERKISSASVCARIAPSQASGDDPAACLHQEQQKKITFRCCFRGFLDVGRILPAKLFLPGLGFENILLKIKKLQILLQVVFPA